MTLSIIGRTKDLRTNSHVIYGQIDIPDYLRIVGNNYDEYGIQRKKEKHKAYQRMKADIISGALLPTITLAVNQNNVQEVLSANDHCDDKQLELLLSQQGSFSILDGLQRTYILNEIKQEGIEFKDTQKLLLEFWVESDIRHLIYRLIILNAGQKPMSMRHQLELLFMSTASVIKNRIPGIELLSESSQRRRSQPMQYPFERVVAGYQSFLWKTPDLIKENVVATQMLEESILDSSEDSLNESFNEFIDYLRQLTLLDKLTYTRYQNSNERANWIANENVINSFFASISDYGREELLKRRIINALNKLRQNFNTDHEFDPLGLDTYDKLIKGFDTRKVNVGVATRKLIMNGFKEYFRDSGEKPFNECWLLAVN